MARGSYLFNLRRDCEIMIAVFGSTGFIGNRFCEMYPDITARVPREERSTNADQILYLISTTHNYNDYSHDVETNELVLAQVLENLKPDQTFNFASSWFVYNPSGNYSFSKMQAEEKVEWYCEREGIPYRVFRFANVFGSGDKYSEQKNALQHLINRLRHNIGIELYYDGIFYRNYIHVDRLCNILFQIMNKEETIGKFMNTGSKESVIFRDLIEMAHIVLGSKSKIERKENIPELHKKVQMKNFKMDMEYLAGLMELPTKEDVYKDLIRMVLDES